MVIQRIQSLLLLLSAVVMGVFCFAELAQLSTPDFTFGFDCMGFTYEGEATDGAPSGIYINTWYFFVLSLLCVLMPLVAIFLFRNLRLQKQLAVFSMLFDMAAFCVALLLGYTAIADGSVSWNYTLMCAPWLSVLSLWLAWRYINRDQRLLVSVDRIR